jgi:hypothetical protein
MDQISLRNPHRRKTPDDELTRNGNFAPAEFRSTVPHPRLAEFDECLTNSRRIHTLVIGPGADGGKVRKIYATLKNQGAFFKAVRSHPFGDEAAERMGQLATQSAARISRETYW